MRKLYLLIYFVTLSLACKAQSYYNKRFDNNGSPDDGSFSILIDSSMVYSANYTFWNDGIGNLLAAGLLKMDLNGNFISFNIYGKFAANLYIGGSASLDKTNDGFILGGSYVDSLTSDLLLYKLKNNGDSIWLKRYGDTAFQAGWMAKQISDGNYVVCGENGYKSDMYLVKTDTAGNVIWSGLYGFPNSNELAYAFTETADHGFALVGYRLQPLSLPSLDIYVVKIDSLGNMQWDTIFGNVQSGWNEEARTIISTHDGNIVFAGNYSSSNSLDNAFMAKMDLAGNILWQKKYGDSTLRQKIYSIKELNDGSIIATGNHIRSISPPTRWGFILKVDSNGDSLWYNSYASTLTGYNELDDIFPTSDGGFIASGTMIPVSPDTGNQDAWFLKIDSFGCEIANCTVSIPKPEKSTELVNVFPDPFSNELNIELKQSNRNFTAHIFDVFGNVIKVFSLSGGSNSAIQLGNIPEGIYFLQIEYGDEKLFSKKIVHLNSQIK